jgi:hypothetical protein
MATASPVKSDVGTLAASKAARVADFLLPTAVINKVFATDKQLLLADLARRAGLALDMPSDHLLAELKKREELGSTAIGIARR